MGCPIGYFTGDITRLLEDAQALKPVYFPSVPRVLNKVYAGASATLANGGLKAYLLRKALDAKEHNLRTTGGRDHLIWDKLVFRKAGTSVLNFIAGAQTCVIDSCSSRRQC